jgi:hypothetical protein
MSRGHSDSHKFSLQYPTQADHTLWKEALMKISSDYYIFPQQLGCFVDLSRKNFTWRTNDDGTILHEIVSPEEYIVYSPNNGRQSCSGITFAQSHTVQGMSSLSCYGSLGQSSTSSILHSWVQAFKLTLPSSSFWERIRLYNNPSLWRNLCCDRNGT